MDLKEMSVSVEATATTTAVLKPTTVIASTISKEYLKILELKEYCKIAERGVKDNETEIQALISLINDNSKVVADYKRRNKINANNSESLLQAKNELFKYKCELKSSYIASEKALKTKQLRYNKILLSYDFNWNNALKEFNASPMVTELQRIEEENVLLKSKIEKQERLKFCTEEQFVKLEEHLRLMFSEKVVEFSKAMIHYNDALNLQKQNEKRAQLEPQPPEQSFQFKLFKERPFSAGKRSPNSGNNDEPNSFSSIDVSIFDDIMIPSESLESQHLEEDVYSASQSKEHISDISKDQEEDLDYTNKFKCQLLEDQRSKKSSNDFAGNPARLSGKTTTTLENESQYFRVQSKAVENNGEKGSLHVSQKIQENEEDISKEQQMEFEECLSEESAENQKEIYDGHYRKTSSFSSDDYPPPIDNINEKPFEEEENNLFRPGDSDKNDFKSFTGFFTMGNDLDSSKPSIFKLF